LRLASFGMVSFREDFHLQDDVHARRTSKKPRRGPPVRGSLDRLGRETIYSSSLVTIGW
jgi:hypothetical protein